MRRVQRNQAPSSTWKTPSQSLIGPPKQNRYDRLKENVGQQENQVRSPFRPALQGLADDKKAVIEKHQEQGHGNAEGRFPAMRTDAQGNAHQRESNACKGKGELPVDLHENR